MRTRIVFGAILLLFGLGIVGASAQSLVFGPSSAVMCKNEVMHPGERCHFSGSGGTTTKSYSQMKDEKNRITAPVAGIVVGAIVVCLAGIAFWGAYRDTRK